MRTTPTIWIRHASAPFAPMLAKRNSAVASSSGVRIDCTCGRRCPARPSLRGTADWRSRPRRSRNTGAPHCAKPSAPLSSAAPACHRCDDRRGRRNAAGCSRSRIGHPAMPSAGARRSVRRKDVLPIALSRRPRSRSGGARMDRSAGTRDGKDMVDGIRPNRHRNRAGKARRGSSGFRSTRRACRASRAMPYRLSFTHCRAKRKQGVARPDFDEVGNAGLDQRPHSLGETHGIERVVAPVFRIRCSLHRRRRHRREPGDFRRPALDRSSDTTELVRRRRINGEWKAWETVSKWHRMPQTSKRATRPATASRAPEMTVFSGAFSAAIATSCDGQIARSPPPRSLRSRKWQP